MYGRNAVLLKVTASGTFGCRGDLRGCPSEYNNDHKRSFFILQTLRTYAL